MEDPEIVWTNEDSPVRVDGSDTDYATASNVPLNAAAAADDDEVEVVEDDEEMITSPADPIEQKRRSRRKKGGDVIKEPKSSRRQRKEAEERLQRQREEEEEVEEVEDEVEEVGDDDQGDGHEGGESDGDGENAIRLRLAALEKKLASGGTVTLNDLQGARARVSATGDFLPGSSTNAKGGGSNNDDSFTMVGLPAQVQKAQTAVPRTSLMAERRQAKLEEALREKKEKLARQAAQEEEKLKKEARRSLQTELLFMDHELDALTDTSIGSDHRGGPPSQVVAAKWLLEHAYTKYPPPSFTKRRAADEVMRARELRFRDSTMSALKLLQARYAAEKNSAQEFGADWAVIAEEISKHAFALCAGINRGTQQEAPPTSAGIFASRDRVGRAAGEDEIDFSLSMEFDDPVEDAD